MLRGPPVYLHLLSSQHTMSTLYTIYHSIIHRKEKTQSILASIIVHCLYICLYILTCVGDYYSVHLNSSRTNDFSSFLFPSFLPSFSLTFSLSSLRWVCFFYCFICCFCFFRWVHLFHSTHLIHDSFFLLFSPSWICVASVNPQPARQRA